uniref:DUF4153 domain-containing protein n=2 Tax=Gelidibacter sp. TaxID=2018083 RepID=UPI00404A28AC
MKIITTIIASIVFSSLFYNQNIGLNLTVFSLLTIAVLGITNPTKMKLKNNLILIIIYAITGALVFIHHSSLAIITNCLVFFTLVGSFSEANSSTYIKWLNGIYTSIAGVFHRHIDVENDYKKNAWYKNIDLLHTAKLIIIPLIVVILFVVLYKNGNPFFESIISKINFDFINFQWILFCILGYFLFSNIIIPVQVQPITNTDLSTGNQLYSSEPLIIEDLKKEKQLGTILLTLLNMLIILYIISDIAYLISNDNFAASVLSNQVHNGINTLIASIIFAILIILYFFRGNLNFFEDNKTLKNLSYVWTFLNVILVILIIIKNNQYVDFFGLTYKRIGVYIYLTMTLAGLITTFLKVFKIKNLWFLFRVNVRIAFLLLMVCSTLNWDHFITDYNINHADSLDVNYLINLSNNNAFILNEKKDQMDLIPYQYENIKSKYHDYVNSLNKKSWQEWSFDNFKINHKN